MEIVSSANGTDKNMVISECKFHPFESHRIALPFQEKRKVPILPLCRAISYRLLKEYV